MKKNEYFEQCLKLNKIKPFSRGSALAPKELDLSLADLKRGQAGERLDIYDSIV